MSHRGAQVLRIVTVAVFAAVAVLAVRLVLRAGDAEPTTVAEPRQGELAVDLAIARAPTQPVIVRGYVFDGPGGLGLRLCNGRQNLSPPLCLGPYLDLDGVNEGSFSLETGQAEAGRVRWVDGPLSLRGSIVGTRMTVAQILQ